MALVDNTLSLSDSPVPVPFFTRVLSILQLIQLTLISENPLVWSFTKGRAHPRADMVGPAYVVGAPSVNCAPGEAVLASVLHLKNSPLFLFSGKILGQNGEPVEAKLDMWQAGTTTGYAFSTYQNRGVVTTNPSTGAFEVLTVPPGAYGPSSSIMRAGHIHAIISAPGYQSVVTQFYICPKNDPKAMDTDPLNWLRAKRLNNMVECWAIPTGKGDRYGDLPQLDEFDTHTSSIVKKWNERLESEGLRIVCGGSDVIRLNKA